MKRDQEQVVLMVTGPSGVLSIVGPMSRRWAEMLFVPCLGDRLEAVVDYVKTEEVSK